jgi:hypothetical protein
MKVSEDSGCARRWSAIKRKVYGIAAMEEPMIQYTKSDAGIEELMNDGAIVLARRYKMEEARTLRAAAFLACRRASLFTGTGERALNDAGAINQATATSEDTLTT